MFVDRDGTVIEDRHYLADPAGVSLIPGSAEAIASLRAAGLPVVQVSNQSGIGRGLFTEEAYRAVQAEVARRLAQEGTRLDAEYFCPDAPGADLAATCRKPAAPMYRRAEAELGVDLRRSYYVGDKASDVEPATMFSGTGILVRTGQGQESQGLVPAGCHVVDDLAAAAALIQRLKDAEASR